MPSPSSWTAARSWTGESVKAGPLSVAIPACANQAPVANAGANQTTIVGTSVIFSGAASYDSDGSIAQVQFFNGATSLGIDTTSPYSVTASNVAAGTYALSAVATDNLGGKATNSITVTVKNPPNAVTLDPALSGNLFTFSFLSQTGYIYTVNYKVNLSDSSWQLLRTTNGTGASIQISDPKTDNQRFYEVIAH